jgi:poly(A)-specific ribonuclease
LAQVFEGNTSLSDIFGLLTDPGAEQLPAVQQLLAAASQAAGAPVQLPTICHAPGCDKYRNLQPGEAAHEAGYDAFMTGAAFARLLPLVQGKCAAEPSSELGTAYARQQQQKQQQQQQQQQPAAHDVTVPAATQVVVGPQSVQLQEPHQQQLHGISSNSQQQQQPAATGMQDPLAFVGGLRGRLNLTFTDIAYAALGEEVDPIPLRPGTFHIEGLNGNWRPDILRRKLQQAGLGQVRSFLHHHQHQLVGPRDV